MRDINAAVVQNLLRNYMIRVYRGNGTRGGDIGGIRLKLRFSVFLSIGARLGKILHTYFFPNVNDQTI